MGVWPECIDDAPNDLCLDHWLLVNRQVYSLLFGPQTEFSLDAPGYLLYGPINDPGTYAALTPLGEEFAVDVLAVASADFDEPGALDNLPCDAGAAFAAQDVSGGLIFADLFRGKTAIAVSALQVSRRLSTGQMSHALHIVDTLPFGLAEALRDYRDSLAQLALVPPPPQCFVNCNGGLVMVDPSFCDQLRDIDTQFRVCFHNAYTHYRLCMRQFIRDAMIAAVFCAAACGLVPNPFSCAACLAGAAGYLGASINRCDHLSTDVINCSTARNIQRQAVIQAACSSVPP